MRWNKWRRVQKIKWICMQWMQTRKRHARTLLSMQTALWWITVIYLKKETFAQILIVLFLMNRFYICCDKCQDWFHGRCVGILQSEAEYIDEYICPNCQKNNSVNFANMKSLTPLEYENLKKLMKQIEVCIKLNNILYIFIFIQILYFHRFFPHFFFYSSVVFT